MPGAQGRLRPFRIATIAAGLSVLLTPSARASDHWLHLSIAPATAASQRAATTAAIVPVNMRPMAPYNPITGPVESSDLSAASTACLVTGSAATVAALAAGWQNVTNLISGGVVAGAGTGAAALGVFGVVFASFCSIGWALAPLYVDLVGGAPTPSPAETTPPRVPSSVLTSGQT
jgi:hypothetical protein